MTTKTPWKDIYFIEDGVNPLIKDFIKDNPFKDYRMSCQEESIRWASLLNISFPFMSVEIHHGMFDNDDDLGNNDSYYDNWVQSFKDIGSFVVFGSIPSSKFKVTNL